MILEYLKWDSNFFGFKVGRISSTTNDDYSYVLFSLLQQAKMENYHILYYFTCHHSEIDPTCLSRFNGKLVDKKIIFAGNCNYTSSSNLEAIMVYNLPYVTDELYNLAIRSGEYSRFRLDNNFEQGSFKVLYRLWIENSVKGVVADKVFVVRQENEVAGMATVRIEENYGDVGLIAVGDKFQGMGLGKKLLEAVKLFLLDQSVHQMQVATQVANKQACQFYSRCGLSQKSITDIYHFWL